MSIYNNRQGQEEAEESKLMTNPYCLPLLEVCNSLVDDAQMTNFSKSQLLAVQAALKSMSTLQCSGCDGLGHSWNGNKHRDPCPSRAELHRGLSGTSNGTSSVLAAAEQIVRTSPSFQCGRVKFD